MLPEDSGNGTTGRVRGSGDKFEETQKEIGVNFTVDINQNDFEYKKSVILKK